MNNAQGAKPQPLFDTVEDVLDALQAYKGDFFLYEGLFVRHKHKSYYFGTLCCPLAVLLCEKTGRKENNIHAPNTLCDLGVPRDVIQEILTGADREQDSPIRTRLLALCS